MGPARRAGSAREDSLDDRQDFVQIERLRETGNPGCRNKVSLVLVQHISSHEDHPMAELGKAPLQLAVELQTVKNGHLRVSQNQIVASTLKHLQGHLPIGHHLHAMTGALKFLRDGRGNVRLVVHDE